MSTPTNPPAPPGGDPSMEDILASIRRILSEDEPEAAQESQPASGAAEARPESDAPPSGNDDVVVLDPSMMVEEPADHADHADDADHAPLEQMMTQEPVDPAPSPGIRPPPPRVVRVPAPDPEPADNEETLVAPEAAAAAASSVGSLMRALSERSTKVYQGGPTLEDLVRDEIRPLLKQWLDTNLPPLVERLVRLEIERVVSRAIS